MLTHDPTKHTDAHRLTSPFFPVPGHDEDPLKNPSENFILDNHTQGVITR